MDVDPLAGPVRVLVVSEKLEKPMEIEVGDLTVRELADSHAHALAAASVLQTIMCHALDWRDGLERAEVALEGAVATSQRAKTARGHLRTALELADPVFAELADAQDALDMRWSD